MGIQGLLPLLKSIMVPIHIKDLQGCSVAVDTYSWLHKGALSCSTQLCKGHPTTRHIDYCMHRVNLLRHNGVKPVLVFDGGFLPMKGEQENKRARARKENLERAMEHESSGNSAAAFECYQKALDISPEVAFELIQVLKQENVSFVVAPYEADAQMTFLAVTKQVDAVITEDSDLIPFGCPRIIYKMDKFGQGVEFKSSLLQQNKELSLVDFTKQMILEMCILSGCDYLPSLPGMGLKRAHALIKKFKSFDKVIKHLRYSTVSVPPLYEESFQKASWTFQHQRVYDPMSQDIIHLTDLPDNIGDDLDFLGPSMPQHIAKAIAQGNLDPFTKLPFQGESVSAEIVLKKAYQVKTMKPESDKKKLDLPVQKNILTNYFCFASLEAKRKFRAPRTTPKIVTPLDGSSPSGRIVAEEDPLCNNINSSSGSPFGSSKTSSVFTEDFVIPESTKGSECSNCDEISVVGVIKSRAPALLQQSSHSIHKPCVSLQKEKKCSYVVDTVEGETGRESRKIIVRSSYFKPKVVVDEKYNRETVTDTLEPSENTMPESPSFEEYSFKGTCVKRKPPPSFEEECQDSHVTRSNVSLSYKEDSKCSRLDDSFASDMDDALLESNTKEEKFGCNISHLDQYSDISDKSMEKFVSIITSFRCSSSGSRASGLRAPLKDVHNTFTNRSSVNVDLSKFSYVPNKRRRASALHRP